MTAGLFSDFSLAGQLLKNRLVVAPMCQYSSVDGGPSNWHRRHLETLAISGAGLMMIESTAVTDEGRISSKDLVLNKPHQVRGFKNLLHAVKNFSNIPVVLQVSHAGRKGSAHVPWVKGGSHLSRNEGGWETVSASSLSRSKEWPKPREMTGNEIDQMVRDFRCAAEKAIDAGLQGVEIHMAHGYLLHQFLSPISNHRRDRYGGTLENRCRFPLEIIQEVRASVPSTFIVGARVTGDDWLSGGWGIEDCIFLCERLKEMGVDYVCVSSGGIVPITNLKFKTGFQTHLAQQVKANVNISTRTAGMITDPKHAEKIIQEGVADMVGIGRSLIKDPWFVYRAAKDLGAVFSIPDPYKRCLF